MRYRAEIDGLRAIAVVPVVLFHSGFALFAGGFVGVDIFFVISGYLITGILVAEIGEERFSLINFYERRARRILPALFAVMLVSLPVAWLWLLPEDMRSFSQSLVAVSSFASNVLFWQTSNYFDTATELKPLLHTWSLSVEEQYYLFFPLLMLALWRLGRKWLSSVLIVLAVLSLAAAHHGVVADPRATFYLLPTRGWELLIGALVAIHEPDFKRVAISSGLRQIGGLVGLFMVGYSIVAFDPNTPFPSLYTLVPTIGTALIILFASGQNWTGQLLSLKPFVWIGLVSYSAYLWHQPLLAFARHRSLGEPSSILFIALIIATFALAYLTWRWVEAPFRNREVFSRRTIFVYSLTGLVMFSAIGLAGHYYRGFPERMPDGVLIAENEMPKIDNGWCFYSVDTIRSLSIGDQGLNCWLGDKSATKRGLLFGDSYAGQYEPFWDAIGKAIHVSVNAVTTNWCYPSMTEGFTGPLASRALPQCLHNRRYLAEHISDYDFVVFAASWEAVLEQGKMESAITAIELAAKQSRLVILMPSPKQFDLDVMAIYRRSLMYRAPFESSHVTASRDKLALNAHKILADFASKHKNVRFIRREYLFNVDGVSSDLTRDGIPFSLDGGHVSVYGSKAAAEAFIGSIGYQNLATALRGKLVRAAE